MLLRLRHQLLPRGARRRSPLRPWQARRRGAARRLAPLSIRPPACLLKLETLGRAEIHRFKRMRGLAVCVPGTVSVCVLRRQRCRFSQQSRAFISTLALRHHLVHGAVWPQRSARPRLLRLSHALPHRARQLRQRMLRASAQLYSRSQTKPRGVSMCKHSWRSSGQRERRQSGQRRPAKLQRQSDELKPLPRRGSTSVPRLAPPSPHVRVWDHMRGFPRSRG